MSEWLRFYSGGDKKDMQLDPADFGVFPTARARARPRTRARVCVCVCVDLCYQEDTGSLQQPSTSADRTCENFEHVLLHSCRGPEGTSYSSGQRSSV